MTLKLNFLNHGDVDVHKDFVHPCGRHVFVFFSFCEYVSGRGTERGGGGERPAKRKISKHLLPFVLVLLSVVHYIGKIFFSQVGACQNLTIEDQLMAGIRYFDIRLKKHSSFFLGYTKNKKNLDTFFFLRFLFFVLCRCVCRSACAGVYRVCVSLCVLCVCMCKKNVYCVSLCVRGVVCVCKKKNVYLCVAVCA